RKAAICNRCKLLMYPGPMRSPENHKRIYCSDGVHARPKPESIDLALPKYPQPFSIFTNGLEFHRLTFLAAVRNIYEKIVAGPLEECDYTLEELAFCQMI
ncbi:hypothetical protein CPB83DRAFT_736118, partial [Crepidotus variabilis]